MSVVLFRFFFIFLLLLFSVCYAQHTIKEDFVLTTEEGIQLAGEIEYPNAKGKFPAAILIWGSGPHTRDEEISGSPIFKQIASELIKNGMAVLRFDKRGQGKSTGDFKSEVNYTTHDLANDVAYAYEFLNAHKAVDTSKVGLMGHSEGSIIASMLAAEDKSIDWVIVFGPAGVSGKAIELDQGRHNRERLKMSEEVSADVGKVWEQYIEFIKDGYKSDSIYYNIGKDFLLAHGLEENDERITHEFIDQLLDGYKTPWHQYFYTNDPADYLTQIKIPFLALFGGADPQTSVALNFMPMFNALQQAENRNYNLVVLADEDHFFFRHKGKRVEKHVYGEMEMSPQFLSAITDWLREQHIIDDE
ncbi:alpha/beta fold hydrolase [Aureisphaera galaxeae]|uniref:alpha/beta hydrolase family protein n=1 Tax=Aureisphaera galaxeae TaxID=1538023 RepID=UPI0023503351|nr:alpha/beta fold hydrolase [Aureisphaera galaxeae]MDC8006173.1 alpha/beta fold hydrolase [Aureisphaera galaxeae]